jgi:DNA invertase Pin-like site-specific DNA recombinase
MENAVIYVRFSSAGQSEQTIEGQIRICKEYADKMGYNVVRIYDGARHGLQVRIHKNERTYTVCLTMPNRVYFNI